MKQFIFAKNIAVDETKLNELADGAIGFAAKGFDQIGGELKDEFNLVVKEGDYLNSQPIHSNKFKWVKSEYQAATTYKAEISTPATQFNKAGNYGIIIVKNGVGFNERNTWSIIHRSAEIEANDVICNSLVKQINKLGFVTATYDSNKITITAKEAGVNYTVKITDNLINPNTSVTETNAKFARNDAKAIKDLYDKCVADRGVNYTYEDNAELYPNLPFNPLKGSDSADNGFTVYTLTFAEPRNTKTTDEVVNQVVHVVFKSNVVTIAFEDKLQAIASGGVGATAIESSAVESPAVESPAVE